MRTTRKRSGATMAFALVLGMVLVLSVVAVFKGAMLVGGSSQVRHAVDAGSLAVGRDSVTVSTKAVDDDEKQFQDVADRKGNFNLSNINRVWAKALLANLNVNAMAESGQTSGAARGHGDAMFQAARRISDRLADQLKKPENLKGFFNKVTAQNSANFLGSDTTVKASLGESWDTSLVDRGAESNVRFEPDQLPGKTDLQLLGGITARDGKAYIPGYKQIKVLDKSFYLIPYKKDERPHLISATMFQENTQKAKPLADWENPVPNAFSVKGKAEVKGKLGQSAVSWVQVNPQRNFDLSMPHAFVRVKLEKNSVRYFNNGIPVASGDYGFMPETQQKGPFDGGVGQVYVTANLGLEYVPPTLFKAIYALPGDHRKVTDALLQRVREINKDISKAELLALLQVPLVPGIDEYLIFPVCKDKIVAAPAPAAIILAPWLKRSAAADGSQKVIAREFAPLFPNFAIGSLVGVGQVIIPGFALSFEHGELSWTPGSGYDGCLGDLEIERATEVFSFGYMIPAP